MTSKRAVKVPAGGHSLNSAVSPRQVPLSHAAMGSNNPPSDATFSMHVDDLFALLSDTLAGGEVSNDEQDAAIDALLDDFRKAGQDAEKLRKAEKEPHLEAGRAVDAKWKPVTDKATRGATACKDALTPYRTAKQLAKDAAAAKAHKEAVDLALAARAALDQSDDLESRFEAEQQIHLAQKMTAIAKKIDHSATGLRTYWEAEIFDRKAALNHYIRQHPEAFEALIRQLADQDARGARAPVPGVVFHERKRAA